MPKVGRTTNKRSMAKELLLTFIATTMSIILTFGTAYLLEKRKARNDRKLMAMTIIQDINMTLDVIRGRVEYEQNGYGISRYLQHNIERLDEIQGDTLMRFFHYITGYEQKYELEFSTSNEDIFNSSQDSWSTLDDKLFMRSVQEFYERRAQLDRKSKEMVIFERPITRDELYQIIMESDKMDSHASFVALCRQLLESDKVNIYINKAKNRMNLYRGFLTDYSFMNETNKNLMYISESDLYDFVHQTSCKTRHATEKQIIGTWVSIKANDMMSTEVEYRRDHTFTEEYVFRMFLDKFYGNMILKYSVQGEWSIVKDSLIKNIDANTLKVEVDENGIIYRPEAARLIQALKEDYESGEGRQAIYEDLCRESRIARGTNIDPTGSRIDLLYPGGAITKFQRKEESEEP